MGRIADKLSWILRVQHQIRMVVIQGNKFQQNVAWLQLKVEDFAGIYYFFFFTKRTNKPFKVKCASSFGLTYCETSQLVLLFGRYYGDCQKLVSTIWSSLRYRRIGLHIDLSAAASVLLLVRRWDDVRRQVVVRVSHELEEGTHSSKIALLWTRNKSIEDV